MNKDSKAKFSYANNYTLIINEDDTVSIKIYREDDIIEFDGKRGNLIIASDFEAYYEDLEMDMTLAECKIATYNFLIDWDVDRSVAEAIIKDLEPWFERYAISEEESTAKKIKALESWIDGRREAIDREMACIEVYNEQIADFTEKATKATEHILVITQQIKNLTERIAELKGEEK